MPARRSDGGIVIYPMKAPVADAATAPRSVSPASQLKQACPCPSVSRYRPDLRLNWYRLRHGGHQVRTIIGGLTFEEYGSDHRATAFSRPPAARSRGRVRRPASEAHG